jgi:LysM repeat protein
MNLPGRFLPGSGATVMIGRIASQLAGYDYAAVQAKVNELLGANQAVYYTVRSGDTLSAIARKYGTSVGIIQKLNASSDPEC